MANPILEYLPQEMVTQSTILCGQLYSNKCCSKLINHLDVRDQECVTLFLIKTLGYGIIALGSIVKLPQVIKILNAKSGAGLSLFGVILELMAITFNSSYNFRNGFPLSTWGECIALALETAFIAYLILWYEGFKLRAWSFLFIWAGILYALNHHTLLSMDVIWYLQSSVIYFAVSAISAWAMFAGSLARILTTVQETGDLLSVITFIFSSCANAVIAAQVLWYWKSTQKFIEKGKKKKNN